MQILQGSTETSQLIKSSDRRFSFLRVIVYEIGIKTTDIKIRVL